MTRVAKSLAVGAVAQQLGVATPTLRTWERRYGLGPSDHTSGGHRRYTPEDVARLLAMHRMLTSGIPPAEAARRARSDAVAQPTRSPPGPGPLSGAHPHRAVRGMLRAAKDLDGPRLGAAVRAAVSGLGPLNSWSAMLVPMLRQVGERWESGQLGVESEHLASACVAGALAPWTALPAANGLRLPVLLACAEDERHALPLLALQAGLAERGVPCQLLGAAVPRAALTAAVRRTGPSVVFLWSSVAGTGGPEGFEAVPEPRRRVPIVLGGPGWDLAAARSSDRDVHVVDDARAAVELVVRLRAGSAAVG
jgi:hypothetical protein